MTHPEYNTFPTGHFFSFLTGVAFVAVGKDGRSLIVFSRWCNEAMLTLHNISEVNYHITNVNKSHLYSRPN